MDIIKIVFYKANKVAATEADYPVSVHWQDGMVTGCCADAANLETAEDIQQTFTEQGYAFVSTFLPTIPSELEAAFAEREGLEVEYVWEVAA